MNKDKHITASKEVIDELYQNSYEVVTQRHSSFFNKIKGDGIQISEKVEFLGKNVISKKGYKWMTVYLDNIVKPTDRSKIRNGKLHDTTLRELYINGIGCVMLFLEGKKISIDSRILFSDSFVYIEIPEGQYRNYMLYTIYSDIELCKSPKNKPTLKFKKGIITNGDDADEIYCSDNFFYPKLKSLDNDKYLEYEKTGNPISQDNILAFESNGCLFNSSKCKYIYDGMIKFEENIVKSNVVFLIDNTKKSNYTTKIDYYASVSSYRNDDANNALPDLVSLYQELKLHNNDKFKPELYSRVFDTIFSVDPEFYCLYLDKVVDRYISVTTYGDISKKMKSVYSNEEYALITPWIKQFYTERFVISFSNKNEDEYAIFINGKIMFTYDTISNNIDGIEYVFINKDSLPKMKDSDIIEIVKYEAGYFRKDLVISVDNDPVIKLPDLMYPSINNIRLYLEGQYVPKKYVEFYESEGDIDYNYIFCKMPVKHGQTLTVENYVTSDEELIYKDNITSSIVEVEAKQFLYPLSSKYYDIFINGNKVYNTQMISANVLKMNNLKTDNEFCIIQKRFIDDFKYAPEYANKTNFWDKYIKEVGVSNIINGNDIVVEEPKFITEVFDKRMYDYYKIFNMFIREKRVDSLPFDCPNMYKYFNDYIITHKLLEYPVVIIDCSEQMITRQLVSSSLMQYRQSVEEYAYDNIIENTVVDAGELRSDIDCFLPIYGIPYTYTDQDGNQQVVYDANAAILDASKPSNRIYKVPDRFIEEYFDKEVNYNVTGINMSNSNVIPINDVFKELSTVRMYSTENIEWVVKKL